MNHADPHVVSEMANDHLHEVRRICPFEPRNLHRGVRHTVDVVLQIDPSRQWDFDVALFGIGAMPDGASRRRMSSRWSSNS